MPYCNVEQCKYNNDHTTPYHTCGYCKLCGHGVIECPRRREKEMNEFGNEKYDVNYAHSAANKLSENFRNSANSAKSLWWFNWCTVNDCKSKKYHTNASHQPLFSQDEFADEYGPDTYSIKKHFKMSHDNAMSIIIKNPGCYYIQPISGMGGYDVYKNIDGIISTININDTNDARLPQFTKGLSKITVLVNNRHLRTQ
jgi:hypothetical protein